jgi:hypothetical protein
VVIIARIFGNFFSTNHATNGARVSDKNIPRTNGMSNDFAMMSVAILMTRIMLDMYQILRKLSFFIGIVYQMSDENEYLTFIYFVII